MSDSPTTTLRIIAADIKLAHSVFAMPFALLASFMAADQLFEQSEEAFWPGIRLITELGGRLVLIVLAMILARSVAMLSNRLLDRQIDKYNPRTASRAIPSGRLPASRAALALTLCAAMFVATCSAFGFAYDNWWPLVLSVPVLVWISAYGWFKRFTSLCHIYLGSSLALSPIAAAIAIAPESIIPGSAVFQPALWLLAAMVLCWVAGFDIIYALQDVAIDRRDGLFSLPARFGISPAMWISRNLHVAALACLIACLFIDERLGLIFGNGIALVAVLLLYEHLTVARWGTTKIALAFFTLNGVISCVLGILGIADVLNG